MFAPSRQLSAIVTASLIFGPWQPAQARYCFSRLLAAAPHAEQQRPHLRDKWAILIGVDKFQDPSVAGNKSAAANVKALQAVLVDPLAGRFAPDHVQTLTGADATTSGINKVVDQWLVRKALPDDLIFVYVCSVAVPGADGEPLLYSFDTLGSEANLSGINLKKVLASIQRRTQSHYVLCALDTSPAPASKGVNLQTLQSTGVSVLSATDGKQESLNNGITGSSVFVHRLADAFKHERGGYSVQQMYEHVLQTVSSDAATAFHKQQTPYLLLQPQWRIGEVLPGEPVKSSAALQTFKVGHPIDRLALEHPEIVPPREGLPAQARPAGASASQPAVVARHVPPAHTPAPAQDEDSDDDDSPHKPVDFSSYMSKMKTDIQKHWVPPKGLEDRRIVAVFTIMRDGRIVDARIVEGSGVPDVDKSALDALKASSPLDPLPAGAPRSVDIKYKFDWQVHRQ
jgi:protein TonB